MAFLRNHKNFFFVILLVSCFASRPLMTANLDSPNLDSPQDETGIVDTGAVDTSLDFLDLIIDPDNYPDEEISDSLQESLELFWALPFATKKELVTRHLKNHYIAYGGGTLALLLSIYVIHRRYRRS